MLYTYTSQFILFLAQLHCVLHVSRSPGKLNHSYMHVYQDLAQNLGAKLYYCNTSVRLASYKLQIFRDQGRCRRYTINREICHSASSTGSILSRFIAVYMHIHTNTYIQQ